MQIQFDSNSAQSLTPDTLTLSFIRICPNICVIDLMTINLEKELKILSQLCLLRHINRIKPNWHSSECVPIRLMARFSGLVVNSRSRINNVFKILVQCISDHENCNFDLLRFCETFVDRYCTLHLCIMKISKAIWRKSLRI